ncbi:MAG: arylamine N-acetyltransferase [Crocinitomicaceae bacterium]|nr:arylamine N-acetyltransferase [Crocinitomicaceae bacterium]
MTDSGIAKYLNRIKLDECTADLAGLMKLQEHHTENIPFENLDIVVGRTIALNHDHLFEKVVMKKRGGYCFELNVLYAELLRSLGFFPKPVLGRVWLSNPKGTPPRNHLANLVELEGRTYVTDVGFGGLITRFPLDINVSSPVNDNDGIVRVIPFTDGQFMIQRQTEKGWENQYSFDTVEISEEDIDISNYYMSTHPNSHLIHHKIVGRNTKDGRIGLFNNKLSTRKGIKVVNKRRVEFGNDWLETIKHEFSVHLDFSEKELRVLFEGE